MKRRFWLVPLVVLALFFAYRALKKPVIEWYAENYIVRPTAAPATETPSQICLTWSEDPRTTQTIQWRTATSVGDGWVQYRQKDGHATPAESEAARTVLEDPLVENDPVNHRFTAVLRGLASGTAYAYRSGSKQHGTWSAWAEFSTAPEQELPFSFVYLGDPQCGLDVWGAMLRGVHQQYADAAFYVIAGDLVNNGGHRNQWDEFFEGGRGVFDRRCVVPALGNHDDDQNGEPRLYLGLFDLPTNGPDGFPAEHAYHFRYSNALFVVLDSNLPPEDQQGWLEEQLAGSDATWKFAVFHHPAYSAKSSRDNPEIRETWGRLFDQYHVDMALQGHDHAYLRTHPMNAGRIVATPAEGTVYVISVSGTKLYELSQEDYTAVGFDDVATYQVIDIETNPDRLSYRAYDTAGALRDELVIEKAPPGVNAREQESVLVGQP